MSTKPKRTRPDAAHSAPHAAPSRQPAVSAAPPPDGPTAAVWAALSANPGATAAQIAAAAGTNRAIAGRELAALETAGRATRSTPRPGAPATWQPATAAETPPGAGSANAGTGHTAAEDGPAEASPPAISAGQPGMAGGAAPEPAKPDATGEPRAADGTEDAEDRPAPGDGESIGIPGESTKAAIEGGGPDATEPADDAESEKAAAAPAAEWTQALELLAELAGAADHATAALRRGDAAAALEAADAACDHAARARRTLKSAVTGRKARSTGESARPGQLRDLVRAHLAAHPHAEFTPHAIGRVLGRSSGAVANALDRLTALGQAQLTSEHPRKYKAITGEAAHSYLAA